VAFTAFKPQPIQKDYYMKKTLILAFLTTVALSAFDGDFKNDNCFKLYQSGEKKKETLDKLDKEIKSLKKKHKVFTSANIKNAKFFKRLTKTDFELISKQFNKCQASKPYGFPSVMSVDRFKQYKAMKK
jgi:hypothetical protein